MTGKSTKPDAAPHLTGDPQNPWGYNHQVEGPMTYRGVEIPVIDDTSSREDLFRYIRILEARLDMTHVYTGRPEGLPEAVKDLGVVLPYDLPEPDKSNKVTHTLLDFVRISQNQGERVSMLARGIDRVGCLEIGEKLAARPVPFDLDDEGTPLSEEDTSRKE